MTETKSSPKAEPKVESVTATLTSTADAAIADARALATALGSPSTKVRGDRLTAELPGESVRNPSDKRQKLVDGLLASPLVVDVRAD